MIDAFLAFLFFGLAIESFKEFIEGFNEYFRDRKCKEVVNSIIRDKKLAEETGIDYVKPVLDVDDPRDIVPLLIDEKQAILKECSDNPYDALIRYNNKSFCLGPKAARYYYKVRVFAKAYLLHLGAKPSELYDRLFRE